MILDLPDRISFLKFLKIQKDIQITSKPNPETLLFWYNDRQYIKLSNNDILSVKKYQESSAI